MRSYNNASGGTRRNTFRETLEPEKNIDSGIGMKGSSSTSASESEDDEGGGEPSFKCRGTAMDTWLDASFSSSGIVRITIFDL